MVGHLVHKPEICVALSDGSQTLYSTIAESSKMADSMPSVKRVRYEFDTPGGGMNGIEKAAIAIKQVKKPTIGVVIGRAGKQDRSKKLICLPLQFIRNQQGFSKNIQLKTSVISRILKIIDRLL